jgi:23S rRNA pseudouridine1911/1915/1917 synthase
MEVLARVSVLVLVECTLHTGRTHQIRVHMAHFGHRFVGDGVYGGAAAGGMTSASIACMALGFCSPYHGGKTWICSTDWPQDMARHCCHLGLSYNLKAPGMQVAQQTP